MKRSASSTSLERPRDEARYRHACPICQGERLAYLVESYGYPIWRCLDCDLIFRDPLPPDSVLQAVYSDHYFLGEDTEQGRERVARMKAATARLYLEELRRVLPLAGGRLLEVGCGHGELLSEATRFGFDVLGVEISPHAAQVANALLGEDRVLTGTVEALDLPIESFDVCVLSDVVEHVVDPIGILKRVRQLLKPGGVILLATPSVDSWSARVLRRNWMEFKLEHLQYFGRSTIENALAKAGFEHVVVRPNEKILTPEYVSNHFGRFRVPLFSRAVGLGYRILPNLLRYQHVRVVPSGILVLARAASLPPGHRLSIILPAYNEADTFRQVMDALLAKELPGLEKEIIVVESNSTDGTREAALSYQERPGVRLVFEDRPCGKGHAVRAGLAHATGEFVMIQDADLEYDVNDYEALLEPLRSYRAAFVLGIRHGSAWKMRQFADNQILAAFMNLGHIFFTGLLNLLYGQRLKDPFTMFKLFRRDCLYGLEFESNRFDFDHELVVKLLRKGYQPLEIPVNYNSRTFSEGKKVRIWRDPFTWIWALVKFRFVPLHRGSDRI